MGDSLFCFNDTYLSSNHYSQNTEQDSVMGNSETLTPDKPGFEHITVMY